MGDLGEKMDVEVKVMADSSAAKGIAQRRGLGKLRHIELKLLWVQEAVKLGRIRIGKVAGSCNPADHLTKIRPMREVGEMLKMVGGELVEAQGKKAKKDNEYDEAQEKEAETNDEYDSGQERRRWCDIPVDEEE